MALAAFRWGFVLSGLAGAIALALCAPLAARRREERTRLASAPAGTAQPGATR